MQAPVHKRECVRPKRRGSSFDYPKVLQNRVLRPTACAPARLRTAIVASTKTLNANTKSLNPEPPTARTPVIAGFDP